METNEKDNINVGAELAYKVGKLQCQIERVKSMAYDLDLLTVKLHKNIIALHEFIINNDNESLEDRCAAIQKIDELTRNSEKDD